MEGGKKLTRNLLEQEPGQIDRCSKAAGCPNITQHCRWRYSEKALYLVEPNEGRFFRLVVNGRVRWALEQLILAGTLGCCSINPPGLRWPAYIHSLRKLGVEVETKIRPYGGGHAEYLLKSKVSFAYEPEKEMRLEGHHASIDAADD